MQKTFEEELRNIPVTITNNMTEEEAKKSLETSDNNSDYYIVIPLPNKQYQLLTKKKDQAVNTHLPKNLRRVKSVLYNTNLKPLLPNGTRIFDNTNLVQPSQNAGKRSKRSKRTKRTKRTRRTQKN